MFLFAQTLKFTILATIEMFHDWISLSHDQKRQDRILFQFRTVVGALFARIETAKSLVLLVPGLTLKT